MQEQQESMSEKAFYAAKTAPKLYKNTLGFSPALLRSSLFSSASRGERKVFSEFTPIATLSKADIQFKGIELRQDDLNVLLNFIKIKAGSIIDGIITVKARKFVVETLGWADSGESVDKLKACIERLHDAKVVVKIGKPFQMGFSFITDYTFNNNEIEVFLSEKIVELLNEGITFMSHAERISLKDGMETWMLGNIKADAWFAPMQLSKFKDASGSTMSQKDFNKSLKTLLNRFKEVGIIEAFEMKAGVLNIKKSATKH